MSTSLTAATLAVTSTDRLLNPIYTVSTLAGNGIAGYADGSGTNAKFHRTWGVTVDILNNVYVGDQYNNRIRKITPSGVVSTLAGSGTAGYADGRGTNAMFYMPLGLAIYSSSLIYVADYANHCIRKVSFSGEVTTLAGTCTTHGFADGLGTNALFASPIGITVDSFGNVYVADRDNHLIRKVTASGLVSTIAGSGSASFADGVGTNARMSSPHGVSVDILGNIFVTDTGNNRIRKITLTGVVSTVAGSGSKSFSDGDRKSVV
jgi:hypothetical protein